MISKAIAREEVKLNRKKLTREQCLTWSRCISDKIMSMDQYKDNINIFLYASCRNEVDTDYLIGESLKLGKNIFLPKVSGRNIKFYHVTDIAYLKAGCFGIQEPDEELCEMTYLREGFFIMPGVAFDEHCNRAGYGAGYYDRFLTEPSEFIKIALAFEFQIYPDIQSEIHDIRPDYVFSEDRIIRME